MTDPIRAHSHVFLVVPHGAAARYLLRTGVPEALSACGARMVALVPNPEEPYIRDELSERGVLVEQLRAPDKPSGRLWTTLVYLRQSTLGAGAAVQTLQARYRNARRGVARSHRVGAFVLDLVLRLLWRSAALRKALLGVEQLLCRPRLHRDLFRRYSPSLVVTTSPGWFLPDAVMLREAASEGVGTAALIVAWDNPTSKGYRGAEPDVVVAWSDRMARQIAEHHDIDPARIAVGGVPQFDVYHRSHELSSRDELFAKLGLDPARRLIVLACRSPSTYAHNVTVATRLAEAIDSGWLQQPAQLVVRPHPINFRSDHRRPMFEYIDLAQRFRNVTTDVPAVSSERLSCDVPESDYRRLAALLAHCDVLVNAFSTTTLEACLLDKPVVLVSQDAHRADGLRDDSPEGRPFHLDTHMEPVLAAGAARVAATFDEVVDAVDAYLGDPSADAPARARVAAEECGPTDGRSGKRIGRFLVSMFAVGAGPAQVEPIPPVSSLAEEVR